MGTRPAPCTQQFMCWLRHMPAWIVSASAPQCAKVGAALGGDGGSVTFEAICNTLLERWIPLGFISMTRS